MPAAARPANLSPDSSNDQQPDDAATSPGPHTYGGRVPLQPELRPPITRDERDAQRAYLRKLGRRRRSPLTRVEEDIACGILGALNFSDGRCDASTMGLFEKAHCSRSQGFVALKALYGLGLIEEPEAWFPDWAACTHTIVRGTEGFRICLRMREDALRHGLPFTCAGHHGHTVFRWKLVTIEDLAKALQEREPKTRRRRRYRTPGGAAPTIEDLAKALQEREPKTRRRKRYRTPGGGAPPGDAYRTPGRSGSEDPYRTPYPGSSSLKSEDDPFSYSPTDPSRARPRDEMVDSGSGAFGTDRAGGRQPREDPPSAAPREADAPRARPTPTSPPPEPAFTGFAPANVQPEPETQTESTEGGRARPGPPGPPTSDVSAVLRAHREHVLASNLSDTPATPHERALVALALATWTVGHLVTAMRGIARATRGVADLAYRRRLAWLLAHAPERDTRIQHAIDGELEAAAARAQQQVRDAPPPDVVDVQVVKSRAAVDGHRSELAAKRLAWTRGWRAAGAIGDSAEQARLAAKYLATFGEPIGEASS